MPKAHHPRRGSLQIWPRVRAKRLYPRLRNWLKISDPNLCGFIGYKAGMTHIQIIDNKKTSPTKDQTITLPVTIIECPPIKIYSLRYYKNTDSGLRLISEIINPKLDKEIKRKVNPPKKKKEAPKEYDELRAVIYTQPKLTGIGKKKPEMFEIGIGGSKEEQEKYAQESLNKEIKVNEVLKEGEEIDIHAVTKGKGFQGPVKRFGVKIRQHKSEKTKRGPGSLGPWRGQGGILWRVAHAGQMGYHKRTEYNKWLVKIGEKPEEINPKGGFIRYGLVKNPYLLIKGSVAGTKKRPIILTKAMRSREKSPKEAPTIMYVSQESQQ